MKTETYISNILKQNESTSLPHGCLLENNYKNEIDTKPSEDSLTLIEKNITFDSKDNENEPKIEEKALDYVVTTVPIEAHTLVLGSESLHFTTSEDVKSVNELNSDSNNLVMIAYASPSTMNIVYCQICENTFGDQEEYKNHFRNNCLACMACEIKFANNIELQLHFRDCKFQQHLQSLDDSKKITLTLPCESEVEESSSDKIKSPKKKNWDTKIFSEQSEKINQLETSKNLVMLAYEPSPSVNLLYCQLCGNTYGDQEEFKNHFRNNCLNCETCGVKFDNNLDLQLHVRECKFQPPVEVSKNTSTENLPVEKEEITEANTSEKKKSPKRKKWEPKICAECGKVYRTNYKLNEHMRKHTGEKPYKCSMCVKAFRSKIGLNQHEAKHTGQYELTCNTCGKGFQCKSYLIVHQRVHSDLKPYPCTTCGRDFKTKQSLLDHMNRHLGVKPYLCDICGRRFITKGLCKSHQKVHSGTDNKQFPCTVCNKMFVSKSYLTTHMRIHTGEKPFMCEVCGKGFLTRVDLRIHFTMHSGEKSFVCEWCGKAFARRDALRCHRRSHTGERPYRCDVCGQAFTQFSPLTIHKRLHTGERPYVCDMCSKSFVSKSTMMAHKKKHHT